ncbi:hypothetical protein AKN40_1041 [Escherichia coli]|nr:hypothetical protein AKN40_1041 [Escherichia coli]EFZ41197.1 hypothetical protein ECEPECA14_3248 [Escherichia coli EPECa14]
MNNKLKKYTVILKKKLTGINSILKNNRLKFLNDLRIIQITL